jgi:hypothetical protein
MQEYFNLDIENNFNLISPKEIQSKNCDSAILSASYNDNGYGDGPITIMTPPLRCSKVRVWPGKNDKFSKCLLDLETTENEWRFKNFLTELSDRCRYLITESAKKWFKYTFSAPAMNESYSNLFTKKNYRHNEPENIQIQLGKHLLNDLDKHIAKSYRNQYLVLRIVFKGIIISNGIFSELWRADQIYKAKPVLYDSDESEYNNSDYEDIGETIPIKPPDTIKSEVPLNTSANNLEVKDNKNEKEIQSNKTSSHDQSNVKEIKTTLDKQKKVTETKIEKLEDNEKLSKNNLDTHNSESCNKDIITDPKEIVTDQLNNNEDRTNSKVNKQLESCSETSKKLKGSVKKQQSLKNKAVKKIIRKSNNRQKKL